MKQLIAILMVLFLAGCINVQMTPAPAAPAAVPAAVPAPQTAVTVTPAVPAATPAVAPAAPAEGMEPAMPSETVAVNALPPTSSAPGPTGARDPIILKYGSFKGVVHPTSGTAKVYLSPMNKKVLGLFGFSTSPGPALTIVMHNGDPANGFVVGTLISASGNYPYDLPNDFDENKYSKVSVYNKKYNVIYGTAELR